VLQSAPTRAARACSPTSFRYARRQPEAAVLHRIVREQLETFRQQLHTESGTFLPDFVANEFEGFLRCGVLAHGFLRLRCDTCREDHLVGFSWPLLRIPAPAAFVNPFTSQGQGILPLVRRAPHGANGRASGGRDITRRPNPAMGAVAADSAARVTTARDGGSAENAGAVFRLAAQPKLLTPVLEVVQRAIAGHLSKRSGLKRKQVHPGAVTLIQRFGSAANLNIRFDVHGCTNAASTWMRKSGP
jgi:hypothetical protein